jgi:hypothetical protein
MHVVDARDRMEAIGLANRYPGGVSSRRVCIALRGSRLIMIDDGGTLGWSLIARVRPSRSADRLWPPLERCRAVRTCRVANICRNLTDITFGAGVQLHGVSSEKRKNGVNCER